MENLSDIAGAVIILLAFALGFISARLIGWKKPELVGTLRIYTGDPDGVYMTLESYVIPEYITTQKEVTLSVDVTDISQK